MAAVDKIYGTLAQYDEFYTWIKEHKPEYLKYFYVRYSSKSTITITNFPEEADMWLINNCTLDWVVDYIEDQYDMKY